MQRNESTDLAEPISEEVRSAPKSALPIDEGHLERLIILWSKLSGLISWRALIMMILLTNLVTIIWTLSKPEVLRLIGCALFGAISLVLLLIGRRFE